jgi:RNA polymerase sigma factor (sigma-70 family)
MTPSRANLVLGHLRTVLGGPAAADVTDWQLLQRFVGAQDQAAFESLMQRHAALIFGVCERALGHTQDAEDVFQATFMVLARKAGSIRRHRAVGSWLYGVAHRLALRARADAARRRRHELGKKLPAPRDPLEEISGRELCRVVDEEIHALAERYRAPLLLCYLQAQTQEEAARQLGWSTRTLRRRLERGRELLQARLTRRGLAFSAALLGTLLTTTGRSSAALARLARAALNVIPIGRTAEAAGITDASLRATALTDGLLRALFVAKLQALAVAVLTLSVVAAGTGLCVSALVAMQPGPTHPDGGTHVATRPLPETPARTGPLIHTDRYGDPVPSGAQVRLGTLRLSVGDWVHASLVFAPDGKTLAAGADGCVRIWDATTGKLVHSLDAPGTRILPVTFAPDGKTLAAGGLDGVIRLWSLTTAMPVRQFRGHTQNVYGLVFSPDGQTLVSGSTDETLRLWRVSTGEECGRLERGMLEISHSITWPIAFLLNNRTVATRDMDGRLRLWNITTGKELHRLNWLPRPLSVVALSADGAMLAATTRDRPTIHLWRIASGQELRQWADHGDRVDALTFSADGSTLASATVGGTIRLWQVATGAKVSEMHADQAGCDALAFSPDGRRLASALDTTVRLWNTGSGEEVHPVRGHRSGVVAVAFAADGQHILSAGMRGTVCRWDSRTGEPVDMWKDPQPAPEMAAAFSPDRRLLASASGEGVLRVSDVKTGAELCRWQGHKGWIFRLTFAPDGQTLASGGHDKTLALWEPLTGRAKARFTDEQDEIGTVAFSPNGKRLAHACQDGTVLVREIAKGKVLQRLQNERQSVRSLVFSPDGKTLASSTAAQASEREPGAVRLWELRTGQVRWQASVSDGRTHCLAFAPDGRTLVLGSGDQRIHRWDLGTGQELASLTGHLGAVRCLAYSPDGSLLASGSMDATVLVWKQSRARPDPPVPPAALAAHELNAIWNDLASTDAEQADRALWCLTRAAGQAVPLLEARFGERFIDASKGAAEELRILRAVEALERVATRPARRLLETFSQKGAGTQVGEEARAALRRLDRRLGPL